MAVASRSRQSANGQAGAPAPARPRRRNGPLAIVGVLLVAVCAASSHWLLADWRVLSLWIKLPVLLATVFVGALVFAGCGVLLHIEELKELRDAVARRLKR